MKTAPPTFHSVLSNFFAIILGGVISLNVNAINFAVTKTTDSQDGSCDTDCSLREAISLANNTPGAVHVIYLQAGTYALTLPTPLDEENEVLNEDNNDNGDLDVKSHLVLRGNDFGETIIDANLLDRHFHVFNASVLTLKKIRLINGKHSHEGGSILNLSTLIVENSKFERNRASSGWHRGRGGAIANYGNLTIQRSEFNSNHSSFGDTSFSLGGAIYNDGNLLIRDAAFRYNNARTDDVLGYGGAIFNEGTADIARTTFVGNDAEGGGMALHNEGTMKLSNATISGNIGSSYFVIGALQNTQNLTLIDTTITDNRVGAGFYNTGEALVRNSIILGNYDDYDYEDYEENPINCYSIGAAAKFSARGLLLGAGNLNCTAAYYAEDSNTFTEILAPLALNNYHIETHALLPDSPAIDAAIGSCSNHDQRWLPRPVDGNDDGVAACDLGAIEL